jgi:hypothetical protein
MCISIFVTLNSINWIPSRTEQGVAMIFKETDIIWRRNANVSVHRSESTKAAAAAELIGHIQRQERKVSTGK